MSYGDERLHCRPLKERDFDKIQEFLAGAPTYSTVLMRRPFAERKTFPGWWYGCVHVETQELRGLACVETRTANIYATTDQAAAYMGTQLLKNQSNMPSHKPQRHTVFGEKRTVDVFWETFQFIKRTVDSDRLRILVGTEQPAEKLRDTVTVSVATEREFKLVREFRGEWATEMNQFDPRRLNPASHDAHCKAIIASGRQLVARKGGKPIFIAELVPQTEGRILIDRVFVPRPFRTFKKMAATALIGCTELALEQGTEALLFADKDDAFSQKLAELAGYEERGTYRNIGMKG